MGVSCIILKLTTAHSRCATSKTVKYVQRNSNSVKDIPRKPKIQDSGNTRFVDGYAISLYSKVCNNPSARFNNPSGWPGGPRARARDQNWCAECSPGPGPRAPGPGPGPKAPRAHGAHGPHGPHGPLGPHGPHGPHGPLGPHGPQGPHGARGAHGAHRAHAALRAMHF